MDDEESILHTLQRLLEAKGIHVVTAKNGEEALALYRQSLAEGEPGIDLLILDLTIPGGLGGKETMEALLEIDPGVNAIVSSGYSSDAVIADYKHYGFKGVVKKPYCVDELMQEIHRVFRD
jgi:CheY-like chemotaxis protein